jgi:2-polyprenyl-3-methyl-5-hydroxy-6-metoxy-1,4-benzoquinol methylase
MMECPLCSNTSLNEFDNIVGVIYLQCDNCQSVFKHFENYPTLEVEKERYLLHDNDITNEGYQTFVQPIVQHILKSIPKSAVGLDFGAGTGPVIAEILKSESYNISLYDPFFHPEKEVLNNTYDFIICCEVIEHFHCPNIEFVLLRKLLKPGGRLFCMTHLLPEKEDFKSWYYKNDPTHVIFYSEENIQWIKSNFNFSKVKIEDRLIIFETS